MNDSLNFNKLKLEYWGLPKYIHMMYENRGIKEMFPWQVECLCIEGVLHGRNLIYSAPTSAGKTLVAEILCLQCVLEKKKKAIIILPFISVVREKVFYFQDIVSETGIRVEGFMGSYHPPGGFQAVNIAICTIEKANNLINRLMEEEELSEIGCVIVDELHMLGDPHRGYLLELLLTKLKYISARNEGINIQIVGMSATLPNLDIVANWLNAALYKTDFRPIPLKEYLKVEKELYSANDGYLHDIQPYFTIKNDPGDVIFLCIDTIMLGFSILVFCPTKNWCETLAQQISSEIRRLGSDENSETSLSLRKQLDSGGISDLLERLKRCPVGLDHNLGRSVAFGVAFHHAGLTLDERDIIEGGFKEGLIRVLIATTTLSSGVNLPARRVIVRSPLFNSRPLNVLTYKQMIGRAGRMGRDIEGESYLICSERERDYGKSLISSNLPPVSSCLASTDLSYSLTRAIIEVIASGVAKNREEVETYAGCTLVHSCDPSALTIPLSTCLTYLETHEFTRLLTDGTLAPSPLAQATLSASLYPYQAVKLLQELHKASSSFILNNHLHAIYQVTPFSVSDQWSVDWMKMFHSWEALNSDLKAVGYLVGVEDSFLVKAMRTNVDTERYAEKLSIHRRFYTALALQDLINEEPLSSIIDKYNCNKGMLQSLQQSASTFAGMVTKFCERLGWTGLEAILENLSSRIEYGAQKDLLDLLKLDCFSVQIARALYSSGIKTVAELASSSSLAVLSALTKLIPFHSENISSKERNSKCIWVAGKTSFTEAEAAQYFIERARKFIKKEMGVAKVDWNDESKQKELDSIYLNSTVNPYDLSKGFDGNNWKLSIPGNVNPINSSTPGNIKPINSSTPGNVKPINSSTPVNVPGGRESVVSSTLKNKHHHSNLLENGLEKSINVLQKLNANPNTCMTPELKVDPSSPSGINTNQNQDNCLTELEQGSVNNILIESLNKSTPRNSLMSKRDLSRLSDGDLFESFDDAAIVMAHIISNVSECKTKTNLTSSKQPRENGSINIDNKDPTSTQTDLDNMNVNLSDDALSFQNNVIFDNNEHLVNNIHSKLEKSKTRNSLDAFFESFSFNNDSFSQAIVAACEDQGHALDKLDSNWGGESLLETSLVLNNIVKKISSVSLKRKLSLPDECTSQKKRRKQLNELLSTSHNSRREIDDKALASVPFILDNDPENTTESKNDHKSFLPSPKNHKTTIESNKSIHLPPSNPTTSTQLDPCEIKHTLNNPKFDFAACSEISVISKNNVEIIKSDSDDSIVESPETCSKSDKSKNISSKKTLQIFKPVKINKNTYNVKREELPIIKNIKSNMSVALTQSFLESAFSDSFNSAESKLINKSRDKKTKFVKMKSDSSISYAISSKKTVLPKTNYLYSKTADEHAMKILKRDSSRDSHIFDSQDVFTTVSRESEEMIDANMINNIVITPTKSERKRLVDSPGKNFHGKIKESFSPRHERKEFTVDSPSKYDKLNVKIIKTPEKSFINCSIGKNSLKASSFDIKPVSNEENGLEVINEHKSDKTNISDLTNHNNKPLENNQVITKQITDKLETVNGNLDKQKYVLPLENGGYLNNSVGHSNNPSLIFPCQSTDLLESFLKMLSKSTNVAVSFNVSTIKKMKNKIGSKIRKQTKTEEEAIKKFTHKDVSLDGVSVYCGHDVYYIDLLCQFGQCYDVVTYLFAKCDLSVYLLNIREKLKMLNYCCGIRVNCKMFDPLFADWLIGTQSKTTSLSELMKDHVRNFPVPSINHNSSTNEVVQVWHLCSLLEEKLSFKCLSHHFHSVEMPLAQILVYMELSGIGFSINSGQELLKIISNNMKKIEEDAQKLAKRTFKLSSSTDLSKVKKLLNISGENEKNHPFMNLIRDWRKLNSLKIRNLNPLMIDPKERLHPVSDTRTATGRITLYEPDLQHIPRDFVVNDVLFSPRSCFIPMEGNVFVGADYCQLELRILAHFSEDISLLSSFKTKMDVFKDIAAKWNQVSIDKVDDEMRHRAKQICYGIIYGMGQTALGEHLGVTPLEASELQAEFRRCYPGIKTFIHSTISECRQTGFVKTLTGRTRQIPQINSSNLAFSNQGERQAVNTKIQGSASDIAKLALVKIETTLMELIPERSKVISDECSCHLVLHLHDEFIYEVSPKYLPLLLRVVKSSMEEAVDFSLPLPVKVRSGESWGLLESVS